jgi:endonuclease/exonuclease/phosphatase family metal-dependent hydrolase
MASLFRSIATRIFVVLNGITALCFLLACLVPFLNPAKWWPIGFLGLMAPYLVILLVFFVLFWLIVKPVYCLLPLIVLTIGLKQLGTLFALHAKEGFTAVKIEPRIRLIDWNVGSLVGLSKGRDKQKHIRAQIAGAIQNMQPDIICLQEFNHSNTQGPQADNIGLFKKTYPYYFFSKDYTKGNGFFLYGSIIFSRYPIVGTGKVQYPGKRAESLIYADILKEGDTMRIFTTHLQSFRFSETDYQDIEKIRQQDKELFDASKSIIKKMRLAFTRRGIQANIVRETLEKSPYPSVMCGDFNDVPNSYTYFHIRGERQDAFLEKSFGIGRTYIAMAPTLRIDYILPDNHFFIHQFDLVDEDLSDHLMLVADISLKK